MEKTRLSEFIAGLIVNLRTREMSLEELGDLLHERGHWFSCLFFAAPFMLPIPLPGLSTPFGVIIILGAVQIAFNIDPWIPDRWKTKRIPSKLLSSALTKISFIFNRAERYVKPRHQYFVRFCVTYRLSALALAILAVLLSLPMPPGFNTPPAFCIILLSLGNLEEDGLLVGLSLIGVLLNLVWFGAVFVIGYEGLMLAIKSLL
ncbi:MAG: exopolysaccharide biosynthesis protein [Proteobacteria bacterium]|nr:exopolysaccharide biosynthesis protein [Pseudomonadota bacterium]